MKPIALINLFSAALRRGSRARYLAIAKGEPVVCVHCGARIETK